MISDRMKRLIGSRFGPVLKYTISGGFFWDPSQEKFVELKPPWLFAWQTTFYVGFPVLGVLILWIYTQTRSGISEELVSESDELLSSSKRTLTIIICALMWLVLSVSMSVGSLFIQFNGEMARILNQIYLLDTTMQQVLLQNRVFRPSPAITNFIKFFEILAMIISIFPLVLPVFFVVMFFHPVEPVHRIVEDFLELDVRFSIDVVPVLLAYAWGAFDISSIMCCFIIMIFLFVFVTTTWFMVATPDAVTPPVFVNGKRFFESAELGKISEDELVWVYRSLQILSASINEVIAKKRMSYHALVALMVGVLSTYSIIRYYDFFLGEDVMGLSLGILMTFAFLLAPIIFYLECGFLDGMENLWMSYKDNLNSTTTRNSAIYKAARSFREVKFKSTHPFFNMNKSTFLDWTNQLIDLVVNLLVSI